MNGIEVVLLAAIGTGFLLLGLRALGNALSWEQLADEEKHTVRSHIFPQHSMALATQFLLSVGIVFFMILVPILFALPKLLFWGWVTLFLMVLCQVLAFILAWLKHYRFSWVALATGFLMSSLIWGNLLARIWDYAPLLQIILLAIANIYLSLKVQHRVTKLGFRLVFVLLVAWSLYLLDPIFMQSYR